MQTYVGSDIAELLLEGYDVDSTLYAVPSQPKANANMTQQETIDRFRQLVMFGEYYTIYSSGCFVCGGLVIRSFVYIYVSRGIVYLNEC